MRNWELGIGNWELGIGHGAWGIGQTGHRELAIGSSTIGRVEFSESYFHFHR